MEKMNHRMKFVKKIQRYVNFRCMKKMQSEPGFNKLLKSLPEIEFVGRPIRRKYSRRTRYRLSLYNVVHLEVSLEADNTE